MKIGVLASGDIPSEWAHSIAVLKNAQGFHDLGHHVQLFSPLRWQEWKRLKETDVSEFYGVSNNIDIKLVTDPTPFFFKSISPLGSILMGLRKGTRDLIRRPFDPEFRMTKQCLEHDLDVAYCRTYRAVKYCVDRDLPVIMESHTANVDRPGKQQALDCATEEQFRLLVTISNQLKERFVQQGVPESKIAVLQDGVNVNRFDTVKQVEARARLGFPQDESIVMYAGSLYPDKGIEHILLTADRVPDAEFVLVGGPEEQRERWGAFVSDQNIENTKFTGHIPNHQIPMYLAAADVLLMPYKTDQAIEIMDIESTSPLKLFEYMAARRPIVSTDIPAISRTIDHGENGLLASPNDVDEVVGYVARLLRDEELATRLGNSARKKAKEHTWKQRNQRMLEAAGL